MAEGHASVGGRNVSRTHPSNVSRLGERLTLYDAVPGPDERDSPPARSLRTFGKRALLDTRWFGRVSFRAKIKNLASWMP